MYECEMEGSGVIQNHIQRIKVGECHMLPHEITTFYLHDLQFHLLYQKGMSVNKSTKENSF